jgi:hypothetical protein
VMGESAQSFNQALLVPARVSLWPKEGFALVIVHAVDGKALLAKENGHF